VLKTAYITVVIPNVQNKFMYFLEKRAFLVLFKCCFKPLAHTVIIATVRTRHWWHHRCCITIYPKTDCESGPCRHPVAVVGPGCSHMMQLARPHARAG